MATQSFIPLLLAGTILFYVGIAFAYFAVFPVIFGFMAAAAPQGVAVMTDISHYLDFVLSLLLAFGAVFEVPRLTLLLVKSGAVDYREITANWKIGNEFGFAVAGGLHRKNAFSIVKLATVAT
ncbi:Sec-independent protein translocase protein TatC [Methylocaldum marinum]|uniref:Sec-independent protein translocase protein TatC n=1 Tax=Methylocaldum marinum TaxID=1432792 RepID=A0A286P488_9GAMM|nr:Sec-independent protein translocase protein TatC [Methylocaldum marinum]